MILPEQAVLWWMVLGAVAVVVLVLLALRRGRAVIEGREIAFSETLALVNRTLPFIRRGLDVETAPRVADRMREYLQAAAVAIVGEGRILAHSGAGADHHQLGGEPLTQLSREVLRAGRPMVAQDRDKVGCARPECPLASAVAAPLVLQKRVRGCLQVYFPEGQPLSASRVKMVTAMAQLMSIQMELRELDRKTERLAKAELAALQAQISPHFVYNTLNTIVSLIRTEPETARQLLTEFADFLRRSLRARGEFSPFSSELDYVHQYLSFEKARFGERLSVVYRVDPEILSTVVPVLVLQPLVENAVRHGVGPKIGAGRVVIAAEDRGSECWICVEDDGVGMREAEASQALARHDGHGLGLANVNERLRSVYGSQYGLQVSSRPGEGTRVSFSVPKFKAGVTV
jgi:two-component system, LytTR family, sensor kinase